MADLVKDYEWLSDGLDATASAARSLAPLLKQGDVIGLSGDLGAGKTTFVQYLASALGVEEPVLSPTFNLLLSYRLPSDDEPLTAATLTAGSDTRPATGSLTADSPAHLAVYSLTRASRTPRALYHFDLYRLDAEEELDDIDFYGTLESDGVTLVEWSSKFPEAMPEDHLDITIEKISPERRRIKIEPHGTRSSELAEEWVEDL